MTIGNPVAILRQKFAQSIGLPFADVLSESDIESALEDEGVTYRKRLFCPIVTLWAWISQVLDKDKSCKKAVSRVISYLVAEGNDAAFNRYWGLLQSPRSTQRANALGVDAFDWQT